MLTLTTQQAMRNYHACYDNDAYGAATDELVWMLGAGTDLSDEAIKNTPDYYALSNLLINVSLEICGHPAYNGEGWQLATSLNAVTEPRRQAGHLSHDGIQKLHRIIDGYLGIYRNHMREFYDKLHADDETQAAMQVETAWTLAQDAVRSASNVREWNGRCAYHLVSAAEGILRTATLMLAQKPGEMPPSRFGYAAEKFGRALRDLSYALQEIRPHVNGKTTFTTASDVLAQFEKEG